MDKVILIQPNYQVKQDAKFWACSPPFGLLYLAAMLQRDNLPVEIIDANLKNLTPKNVAHFIKVKKAKYVGFSILTPAADWCVEAVGKLPGSVIKIAGGAHASAMPEDLLKSGFDIVVIGEGEETIVEIAQGKRKEDIKGIAYLKRGKLIYNLPRSPMDPNKIPWPARNLIEKAGTNKPYMSAVTRYRPWAPILTSRGCPYNCYFCNKKTFGQKFRTRNPEDVLAEIDFLVRTYQIKEINFYDDCFNFDIKRAEKIMDLITKRDYKLYLRFNNGLRADKVTKNLLMKMKKAGTDFIAFGIESGDKNILKSIPKGESLGQISRAVKLTKKVGIPVMGFFMLGLIGDTKKTMQKTIDVSKKLPFDWVVFNIATPYPGTKMWQMIHERGGQIHLQLWQDFHSTASKTHYSLPGMAEPDEVGEMLRKAYFSFYLRPSYIIKRIPNLLSLSLLPQVFRGLSKILYILQNKTD